MFSTRKDYAMTKQKSRGGRPPLSVSEKSVPTVIRLLPSVRSAIKSEAERQDVTVSELLRDIVEGRVVQMVREDDVPQKWNEQVFRDLMNGKLEIQPRWTPTKTVEIQWLIPCARFDGSDLRGLLK
jgi:hypothetical protein